MTKTEWNFRQMSDEDIEFCKREARKLAAQYIKDDAGTPVSYEDWLECISESIRLENEEKRGQYCGEMGEI